jgi:hypothetical protein
MFLTGAAMTPKRYKYSVGAMCKRQGCSEPVFCRWLCKRHRSQLRHAQDLRRAPWRLCECGCNEMTRAPRFVSGHNSRTLSSAEQSRRGRCNDGAKQRLRGDLHNVWYRVVRGRHEHRAVIERILGRRLKSNEIVHHLDENKRHNKSNNLVLTTRKIHVQIHLWGHA